MAESTPLQFDLPDMDGQDGVNVITEGREPALAAFGRISAHRGSTPQTLSHLAFVNAALGLSGTILQRGGC